MSLTPRHRTTGLLAKDLGKDRFSLAVCILANLLIALEPAVGMLFDLEHHG